MSARICRLEIVRGDAGFFWRFVASNGKTLCNSETYRRRIDAKRSAHLVLGTSNDHSELRDGMFLLSRLAGRMNVAIVEVDERTAVTS